LKCFLHCSLLAEELPANAMGQTLAPHCANSFQTTPEIWRKQACPEHIEGMMWQEGTVTTTPVSGFWAAFLSAVTVCIHLHFQSVQEASTYCFSLPRGRSNIGTGFLEMWVMPQACQCLRDIQTMPFTTCFNFWSALNCSGSWTR